MIWLWIGFIALVFVLLALDLGVFHRTRRTMKTREALIFTGMWIGLSLAFSVVIYAMYHGHWFGAGTAEHMGGKDAGLLYLTGYVIEKSLSLDNIFVIALIFAHFKVPNDYQHRVLFWGILGALLLRGAMIGTGAALIRTFAWTVYAFGAFLLFTAVKMLRSKEGEVDPGQNILVRVAGRIFPMTDRIEGGAFFTNVEGHLTMTPLFLVLMVVESTDVLFAVDSIPAIFAVTDDPYLIFTSNIFAILGLRTLYFALAAMLDKFRYLKQSLVFVLAYVGLKMIFSHQVQIPSYLSLGVIVGMLGIGVLASIAYPLPAPAAVEGGLPETPGRGDLSP